MNTGVRSFSMRAPRMGVLDATRAALVPWTIARLVVPGALALARHLSTELAVRPRPVQLGQGLTAWDGAFYTDIARHGYEPLGREGYRFFPLFPLLGRACALLPGVDARLGLVLVANGAALVAGILTVLLVERETADTQVARRSAWLLALAPPATVLVMAYAEALFLALALGTFLALRSRHFALAAACGALAALSRPVGLLLAVPALLEGARGLSTAGRRALVARVSAVFAPFAGVVTFAWWVRGRTGDFWLPFRVQSDPSLRGKTVTPFESLADAADALFKGDRAGTGLHFVTAFVAIALLVVCARRLPAAYTAYAAVTLGVLLTASSLNSLERYVLVTFPLLFVAAMPLRRPAFERAVLTLSTAALFALAVLTFSGVHVP